MSVDSSFVARRLAQVTQEIAVTKATFYGAGSPEHGEEVKVDHAALVHASRYLRGLPDRSGRTVEVQNAGAQP